MKHDISDIVNYLQNLTRDAALVAVSKGQDADAIKMAFSAGLDNFAENYVQEALDKINNLSHFPITWHFTGQIQSNKIPILAEKFHWIQTLSNLKHAKILDRSCKILDKKIHVLMQINITDDSSRYGIDLTECMHFAQHIESLNHLNFRGVMAMYSNTQDTKILDKEGQRAYKTFSNILAINPKVDTLSLGMSSDFKHALSMGSNMVRLGRIIFGERHV